MPAERSSRPRQDPVSCDSCRKKKLKCDRDEPCSNCTSRGIQCAYSSRAKPSSTTVPKRTRNDVTIEEVQEENAFIKARLARLEEALLSQNRGASALESPATTTSLLSDPPGSSAFKVDVEFLLNAGTPKEDSLPNLSRKLRIRVDELRVISENACRNQFDDRSILLPTEDEAGLFFDAYLEHLDPAQHILHVPSVRASIASLYCDLGAGREVDLNRTLLLLSIISSIGIHWGLSWPFPNNSLFDSHHKALQTSILFVRNLLDALDAVRRSGSAGLEAVQASIFTFFLIYHLEGHSPRFKALFTSALSLAKHLGLHRLDLNSNIQDESSQAEIVQKEVKRRVWWHLVGTDWSIGFTGGSHEGTYNIQPRHMRVNRPRNISDDELSTMPADFDHVETVPTIMAYFFQRMRLSEICRQIADLSPDMAVDKIPPESLMTVDREFERVINEMPPFLRLDTENREQRRQYDISNPGLAIQRYTAHVMTESRRCQLHVPSLLRAAHDDKYAWARQACLKAARNVITAYYELSYDAGTNSMISSVMRGPLYLFFFATVLLVMDICVNGWENNETGRKAEIEQALEQLENAKSRSHYASTLIDSLKGLLRKHKIYLRGCEAVTELEPDGMDVLRKANPFSDPSTETVLPTPNTTLSAELMQADDMWRNFFDGGAYLEPHNWDAWVNDLDLMV